MKVRSWSMLSTLALAGALVTTPAAAGGPMDDGSPLPNEGAIIRDESLLKHERRLDAAEVPASTEIDGQVAAIERSTGRLILDTEDGPISLTAAPEDLEGIEVGDIVRVSLATD